MKRLSAYQHTASKIGGYGNAGVFSFVLQGALSYVYRTDAGLSLFQQLALSPVLFVGIGYVLYRSVKKDISSLILVSLVVASLPHVVLIGQYNLRLPQNLIVIIVLYISLAAVLAAFVDRLSSLPPEAVSRRRGKALLWLLVAFLIVIQASYDSRVIPQQRLRFYTNKVKRLHNDIFLKGNGLARWLDQRIVSGESILTTDENIGDALYLWSRRQFTVSVLSRHVLTDRFLTPKYPEIRTVCNDAIALLGHKAATRAYSRIYIVTSSDIRDAVSTGNVKYIVVSTNNYKTLIPWLRRHPGLSYEDTIETYAVFRVKNDYMKKGNPDIPLLIDESVADLLRWLHADDAKRFEWFSARLSEYIPQLQQEDLRHLIGGTASKKYLIQ
jgi:hypothetical protein